MRFFIADLHIHTVLSACAETEMLPELIVGRAQALGVSLIAVTDHNSAENAAAVINAAGGTGITVLPGMEVQTREEAHMICLFDSLEQAQLWQAEVYAHLPSLKNKENVFGTQVVLDVAGEPVGVLDRLLATSTSFSVEQVVNRVRELGGLCIPAHVDRPAYSLIANLGFIPPELDIRGVEISHLLGPQEARARFPQLKRYSLVANGDAHRLKEIARRTTFKMAEVTVAEIALALAGVGERGVWVDGFSSLGVET
ncbi:MAG: PHP domain-containing protein [Thermoflexales bacterium]|nr:PHP domain-containing protein [Thermoflexales bacterium]